VVGSAGVVLEVPEVEFGGDLQLATCCVVGVARSTFRQPNSYLRVNHGEQAARDRSGDKQSQSPEN
jgi:hypothetical protein